MALQKEFQDAFRLESSTGYWKLTAFTYDNFQQVATLTFSCFESRDAANAKKQPFQVKSFILVNADYDMVNALMTSSFKAQAYAFAKQYQEPDGSVFFAGAQDV